MRRIGVHTSIAGGLPLSLRRAHELVCNTMQIFSHNPRGWALKEISEEDRDTFRALRKKLDISPVFIHTSYLINMAASESSLRRKSINMLTEEMNRADLIGADYVILHTGSASGDDEKTARKRAISALQAVFYQGKWKAGLLLENTAGERGDITSGINELAEIFHALSGLISGICIDTCHAFQAGYDIRKYKGIETLSDEIERYIGTNYIKLIHLNDSKAEHGLHKDRHEHIGKGKIGGKGLRQFLTHKNFSDIPLILETPKKAEDDDKRNLKRVRRLISL